MIRPYNSPKKKRTCKIVDFAVPAVCRVKLKESKRRIIDLAKELKKKQTVKHESDVYTNRNWCFWYSHQRIIKGTGGLGNKRSSGNYPNYYIIEIDQNTEKSPGYLRTLVVTQTPVKDHQLTLM